MGNLHEAGSVLIPQTKKLIQDDDSYIAGINPAWRALKGPRTMSMLRHQSKALRNVYNPKIEIIERTISNENSLESAAQRLNSLTPTMGGIDYKTLI